MICIEALTLLQTQIAKHKIDRRVSFSTFYENRIAFETNIISAF